AREAEIVISCLPRGVAMGVIPQFLEQGCLVIDLSGDFRLLSPEAYRVWYGDDHKAPHLLNALVYGLPEIHRDAIRSARLVGAPGCYPTSVILGLAPLLEIGAIDPSDIIVDAKSGVSGAGRKLTLRTHFVESNETIIPYDIGRVHRHAGEMEQELSEVSGQTCRLIFTPQQIPISRGILSMIYVRLKDDLSQHEIIDLYKKRYEGEPFMRIAEDYLPEPRFVAYTNFCDVAVHRPRGTDRALLLSTIDNLLKGAVGQIVQCLNLMIGVDETTGLR
ncbi:MAG: N-acetyl-gamma-glutamyl-phosphate reductase, partial [Candidatus Latescibacteria bacterium]|nr:N-acetyl-gamma-glutamyl-phosphate reductase [Candidatus Latescibacterota bacterium]